MTSIQRAIGISMVALMWTAAAGAQVRIGSAGLQLALDPKSLTASLSRPGQPGPLTNADPGVVIWDGQQNQLVPLKLEGTVAGEKGQARFTTAGDGLRVEHHLYEKDAVLRWDVTIQNQRKDQAWLEIRYAGQLRQPRPWMFYNAAQSYEPAATEYTGQTTFWPAVAMAGPKSGFWVGVDPHQIYSLITYSFQGEEGKQAGAFYSGARIVLDPGQSQTVGFTLLGFDTAYGHLSALQAYYDAFPDCFNPASNIDPRILRGGDAGSMSWRSAKTEGADSACEIPRRTANTWDWMYAPFPIPGDVIMTKDRWELTKPEHRNEHAHSWKEIEAFRRIRKNYFYNTDIKYDVAPMFYVIPWVHEDLARTIYQDSMMTEDMGWENNPRSHKGWIAKKGYVKVGPFDSIEVFGWGTSAGDTFKKDYKALVESDLTFSGFAFDSNVCGGKYRGPRLNELPGRAWDAEGVFVSEGVAQSLMADYLHGMQKEGYRVGVVANQPGTHYAMAFRTDASILEIGWGNIVLPSGQIVAREYARAQAGHKPRNIHSGFSDATALLPLYKDWEKHSPEQIRQTMQSVEDRVLIFALAYGWNLSPDMAMPDARMLKYAHVVADLNRRGWQPIPAMRLQTDDKGIYLSRYGDRNESIFCLGNNREERLKTDVTLDPKPLGDRHVLLSDYWGAPVPTVSDQYGQRIGVDLAPRGVLVLRSAVFLKTDAPFTGSAARQGDEHAGKIVADLTLSSAAAGVPVQVVVPQNVKVASVTLNGQAVEWKPAEGADNVLSLRADLKAGKNVLEANYASTQILCSAEDLKKFPFLDEATGQPRCQIVIADQAQPREQGAAFRLGEYFRYWTAMKGKEVQLPIVPQSKAGDMPRIYIGQTQTQQPVGVVLQEGNLFIRGKDARQTNRLLDQVLAILDQNHPVVGKFQNQIPYPNRPLVQNYYPARWSRSYPWIPKENAKLIEQIFKKGEIWQRPLRENTLPAGVTTPSRVTPPSKAPAQASAHATGPASAQLAKTLFNAEQEDLYFDKQPFRLINDAGQMTYGGFQGAVVFRIQAKPKTKSASLIIPLPKPDALAGLKTLHLRLRLVEPATLPPSHLTLTARAKDQWLQRLTPQNAPRQLEAGQWYDLQYALSAWKAQAIQYLRLYHAPAKQPQPLTYDIAAIWGE